MARSIENLGEFSFGTFLFDSISRLPIDLNGVDPYLSLGNSAPQQEAFQMKWVAVGGKLFASTPIQNIPWDCIHHSDIDVGQEIRIDGMRFTMRLPVFGYDQELDEVNWFWGCWALNAATGKACQLWRNPENGTANAMWLSGRMTEKKALYPILEPRMPDLNVMAGVHVNLMTPAGLAECHLKEVTDYDLVCSNYKGRLDTAWGRAEGEMTYLNREVVLNIGFYCP